MTRTDEEDLRREGENEEREMEAVLAELARVRARLGVDPATSPLDLSRAWTSSSGTLDEDEAELVDVLADCLSVGLPMSAAFAPWMSGEYGGDDENDEQPDIVLPVSEMHARARHRIIVR